MDSTLFYLLVGTGIVSVLTVIYVLVDERARIKAYEKNRPPQPEPAADVKTPAPPEAASLSTNAEALSPNPENPENPA
jgi:hypothetical protein